jgi:hypothetical protein
MKRGSRILNKSEGVKLGRIYLSYLAVVWWVSINTFALASNQMPGKLIGKDPINAILMEDHSDSFIAWRLVKVKQRTIVHIDSHIDLEWISDLDLRRIRVANIGTESLLWQGVSKPWHPLCSSSGDR